MHCNTVQRVLTQRRICSLLLLHMENKRDEHCKHNLASSVHRCHCRRHYHHRHHRQSMLLIYPTL